MAIATEDIVADGYGTEARSPVQVHPVGNGYNVIYEGDERGCFKVLDDLTTEERGLHEPSSGPSATIRRFGAAGTGLVQQ